MKKDIKNIKAVAYKLELALRKITNYRLEVTKKK